METTNYQDVIDFLEEQKASCGIEENQYFEAAVNTLRKVDRLEAENDRLREAMRLNCLICESMHENGNCTEVGGFCTAIPAAHCPLIPRLRDNLKKVEAERDDILAILHSYRHICGERTPDELSRLVQADEEGRCLVIPIKVGQIVRHKNENWIGQVSEITLNNEGTSLFVSSGGYTGYYPPDVFIVVES